jgi:4-diphosphocytidyl-2-C-methyl-D-erythritol kinase
MPNRAAVTAVNRCRTAWRFERAPAKVNLGLRVTGKRDDGYHLLDSLVLFANIGDVVALRPSDAKKSRLCVRGPFANALSGDLADNLVLQAAEAFRSAFGGPTVDIILWKHLPVAAGIGGGSADAAAVLRLLQRGKDISKTALIDLALSLGADMPMCLANAPVRIGGIGEKLLFLDGVPSVYAMLCNPGIPCSTPAVFKARTGAFSGMATIASATTGVSALAAVARCFGNDLTAPAIQCAPEIGDCLRALERTDGTLTHGMSGSGATCFALFETKLAARKAAKTLANAHPDWWVRQARLKGSAKAA